MRGACELAGAYLKWLPVYLLFLVPYSCVAAQEKLDLQKVYKSPVYNVLAKRNWIQDGEAILKVVQQNRHEFIEALLVYITYDNPKAIFDLHLSLVGFELTFWTHNQYRKDLVRYLSLGPDGRLERYGDDRDPLKDFLEVKPSVGATARHLLRFIDSIADSPWMMPLMWAEWKLRNYDRVIADYKGNVPTELVEYLFEEFPEDAWMDFLRFELSASARSEGITKSTKLSEHEFQWAAHVIKTTAWRLERGYKHFAEVKLAQRELELLANDTAWYSRRYVVHVLLKYPYFRTPELVKRLQEDKHPLVRDRAKFLNLDK